MTLALALVVRLDQHQPGQLAMRARRGLQGHASHAGDLGQVLLQLVVELDRTLGGAFGLQGMDVRETG